MVQSRVAIFRNCRIICTHSWIVCNSFCRSTSWIVWLCRLGCVLSITHCRGWNTIVRGLRQKFWVVGDWNIVRYVQWRVRVTSVVVIFMQRSCWWRHGDTTGRSWTRWWRNRSASAGFALSFLFAPFRATVLKPNLLRKTEHVKKCFCRHTLVINCYL